MSDKPSLQDQLELMKQRLESGGMNRRDVLKVAAAATGAAAVTGAISYGDAAASPLTGRRRLRYAKPQAAEEQIFYHTGIYTDPTSFDWNANLYCNAEEETFAGVLTVQREPRSRRRLGRDVRAERGRVGLDLPHPPGQQGLERRNPGHCRRLRLFLAPPA